MPTHRTTSAWTSRTRVLVACLAVALTLAAGSVVAAADEPAAAPEADAAAAAHPADGAAPATGHHGEHFTWMSFVLDAHKQAELKHKFDHQTFIGKQPFSQEGHLTHVFMAGVAFLIVIGTAIAARNALSRDTDAGVLPARKLGPLLMFELFVGSVWNLMKGMMGPVEARRHFPIICTLAVYIFTMNALALLPGGAPPTDNLNTNIVMGLTVFLATHISGIRVQGPINYAKHFAGPILALAPLIAAIEIISHVVRPLSLSLRLLGNMTGDHKVLEIFLGFEIPLLPLPLMMLGLMVVCIQTLVFVLLSTVYLSMAVAQHDHGDEAHGHH